MPKTTNLHKKKSLFDRLTRIQSGSSPPPRRTAKSEPVDQDKHGATQTIHDLLERMGDKVEPALYALLCDTENPLRKTTDDALHNGTRSAIAALVPLLIAQFALAPAVAVVVAGFAVKTLASKGQNKLCEELAARQVAKQDARHRPPKPKAKPRSRAKPRAARPKARPRAAKSAYKK